MVTVGRLLVRAGPIVLYRSEVINKLRDAGLRDWLPVESDGAKSAGGVGVWNDDPVGADSKVVAGVGAGLNP